MLSDRIGSGQVEGSSSPMAGPRAVAEVGPPVPLGHRLVPGAQRALPSSLRPGQSICICTSLEPEGPAVSLDIQKLPRRDAMLLLVVAQDVGHVGGETTVPSPPSTSWGAATSLAGFQVSTTGRFWVSTEGPDFFPTTSSYRLASAGSLHNSSTRRSLSANVVMSARTASRCAAGVRSFFGSAPSAPGYPG